MPDIETVRKLCDVLEISKDEILGGSIEETKKSRAWLKVCIWISVISVLVALFLGLGGADFIKRRTQSGVVYACVFWNGELLQTEDYLIDSDISFEDYKNGYRADVGYGEIRGTLRLADNKTVEFGFINVNNWHNIHIRLDITDKNGQLSARQTVSYETDNNTYQVKTTEGAVKGGILSVYTEGV